MRIEAARYDQGRTVASQRQDRIAGLQDAAQFSGSIRRANPSLAPEAGGFGGAQTVPGRHQQLREVARLTSRPWKEHLAGAPLCPAIERGTPDAVA